jgi:ACR3 family arsenite efflux pump ArsB
MLTLILIFAFQAMNVTGKGSHVLLIAIPILVLTEARKAEECLPHAHTLQYKS